VSRRLSVVTGFYQTCVIDGILHHCAARQSPNLNDFALVAMLGLLGLRIFEATDTAIAAGREWDPEIDSITAIHCVREVGQRVERRRVPSRRRQTRAARSRIGSCP
jgi:hypothetical protein